MTRDRRWTVRFTKEQAAYLDRLATRHQLDTATLISETALRYAEQAVLELKDRPKRRQERPPVDLVRHLCAKYGISAELARRRIALDMVLLDGQPFKRPTITRRDLRRLQVAWE